jgi:hypothetical protein
VEFLQGGDISASLYTDEDFSIDKEHQMVNSLSFHLLLGLPIRQELCRLDHRQRLDDEAAKNLSLLYPYIGKTQVHMKLSSYSEYLEPCLIPALRFHYVVELTKSLANESFIVELVPKKSILKIMILLALGGLLSGITNNHIHRPVGQSQ